MVTYKVHILRTGKTSDGPWKRYVGQSDIPLSDKGREGLAELKFEYQYPKVDIVFSSPLKRCLESSEIIYPDKQIAVIDGLKDMNLGSFEGKTFEELREDEAFVKWLKNSFENDPPNGEPTAVFTKRITNALADIFTKMMQEKIKSAAVMTHGGVIMSLLAAVGVPKMPLHQWAVDNGGGYTLIMTPQMWMRDNSVEVFAHLPEARTEDDMNVYGLFYNE